MDIGPDVFYLSFVFGCAASLWLCRLPLAEASRGHCLAEASGLLTAVAFLVARALVAVARGA